MFDEYDKNGNAQHNSGEQNTYASYAWHKGNLDEKIVRTEPADTSPPPQKESPWKTPEVHTWSMSLQPVDTPPEPRFEEPPAQTVKKERRFRPGAFMAAGMIFSMLCGLGGGYLSARYVANQNSDGNKVVYQSPVLQGTGTGSNTTGTELSVTQIAEMTQNSVVEIVTETTQQGRMFGQSVSTGAGSGVIVTTDGYIITNNHVVSGTSKITVRLKDERSFTATLVGTDSKTDIAILKIDADNLKAAMLGDSSALKVGETAVAVGNPLGQLGGTVTNGIISALDREIEVEGEKMTLLQTNAAINPGNSGGGLFNGQGALIGIVNAKSSGSDVEGLGFAIPINSVKPVMEDIMNVGYVTGRVELGVSVVDITDPQTAMMYGVSRLGVYVLKVTEGSAAQSAGFAVGDLIVSVNGQAVSNYSEFNVELQKNTVGAKIEVVVQRDNESKTLTPVLTEYKPA